MHKGGVYGLFLRAFVHMYYYIIYLEYCNYPAGKPPLPYTTAIPLFTATFIGLLLGASLSPLLTFGALFQLKEWRVDRLGEHLRREGRFRSLWGWIRPAVVLLALMILPWEESNFWVLALLSILTSLNVAQIVAGRQRFPVWTKKAVLVCVLSMLFLGIIGILLVITDWAVLGCIVVLILPAIVLLAWTLLLPLDAVLKKRIYAKAKRARASLPQNAVVIGIAGSVGKTTVKELLAHLLQDLHPIATPAHVNSELGVAGWFSMKTQDARRKTHAPPFIIELGAYRKGEIRLMCDYLQPTIGVMTALGGDHLALFGSEDAIVEANAELLEALPKNGHAFLLADNKRTHDLSNVPRCPVTLAGMASDAVVRARLPVVSAEGIAFTIDNEECTAPLQGLHNVLNAALAIAVARHLGIDMKRIVQLLNTFHPLEHTFRLQHQKGITLLDDTYNVSVLSFAAAIEWARNREEKPKILLTSGLMEIGKEEDRHLRALGEQAAAVFDRVIFTTSAGMDAFQKGFTKPLELLTSKTMRSTEGSLLVCIGRMPLAHISRLLPS